MSQLFDLMDEPINEQYLYDYLLKDCISLTQQIEELLKESTLANKKTKVLSINLESERISEEKFEKSQSGMYLKTEPSPKMLEQDENDTAEEIKKRKENLLKDKKNLEDQFLEINIDIQRKGKQLGDFQDEIKKTETEIIALDKQIKEKTAFVQLLESQIYNKKK